MGKDLNIEVHKAEIIMHKLQRDAIGQRNNTVVVVYYYGFTFGHIGLYRVYFTSSGQINYHY